MNVDLTKILSQAGADIVSKIRQNLAATGTNATGSTSKSLRFQVTTNGTIANLRIIGRPYFMAVETGIKPYPQYDKPSREFVKAIREWLAAKSGEQGAAYAIARSIHKKGTKLWQRGGRTDVVTNDVPGFNDLIRKAVLNEFVKAYIANLNAGNSN